jgi:hypothetical protein
MDNCMKDNKNRHLLAFISISFIVNYKGCVWRNETRISCHLPYTKEYWRIFWLPVKKVERITELHFGWFDEGVHGLPGRTIYSSSDSKYFRF